MMSWYPHISNGKTHGLQIEHLASASTQESFRRVAPYLQGGASFDYQKLSRQETPNSVGEWEDNVG